MVERYARILVPLFLCTLAGLSCAERRRPPAVLHRDTGPVEAGRYLEVLDTWTRDDKVYDLLDNKIFISATFHAPQLRRAFASAFPDIYGHGGTITRRELVELTENIERSHTFFVSAFTSYRKWNDLEKDDSIWRLTLMDEGEERFMEPTEIISVKIDANLEAVYPYIGRFDEAYLVRFPLADEEGKLLIPPGSKGFTLRLASALGVAQLRWELVP